MNIIIACVVAAVVAFGISFGLGYVVIPFLHKLTVNVFIIWFIKTYPRYISFALSQL